tara:strand:+ start:181 stop:609 length:429 start_codon:yes stop_codon:yes gene_type:complete
MEWTQLVLPAFVALEILIILALYRYILRDWIIEKWEAKMDEEGWLVIRLEPVIDEIEERMHDKLEAFQKSFFGSIGAMTQKAQNLDPMKNIRKAAKDNDWTSMLVEYAANKAGIGPLLAQNGPKEGNNGPEKALPKPIKGLK